MKILPQEATTHAHLSDQTEHLQCPLFCIKLFIHPFGNNSLAKCQQQKVRELTFNTYLDIKTITRRGSLAIVNTNRPNGGPNAMNVQPKNSIKVMVRFFCVQSLPICRKLLDKD